MNPVTVIIFCNEFLINVVSGFPYMFDRTGLDIAQGIYTSLKFFVLLNYFSPSSFQSPNSISKLHILL